MFRFILQSAGYVERLERHYRMFRETVDNGHGPRGNPEINRIENRKHLRDPKRRPRRLY